MCSLNVDKNFNRIKISVFDILFFGYCIIFAVLMKQSSTVVIYGAIAGLFIVSLFVSYVNPFYLLVLLVLFMTNFMGFVPSKVGDIQIGKFTIIILIDSYMLWALHKFKSPKISRSYITFIVLTLFLIAFGSIMAAFKIEQSILMGIVYQQRILLLLALVPLCYLLSKDGFFEKFESFLIIYTTIFSVILILQVLLVDSFVFLQIDKSFERLGKIRISIGFQIQIVTVFLLISKILKKFKLTYLFELLLIVYCLVFIYQGRMALLGLVVGAFILFAFNCDFKNKYKLMGFIAFLVFFFICLIVFRNQLFDLFTLTQDEFENDSGSYGARIGEFEFYTSQVDKWQYVLFGRGYISPKTPGGEELDTLYNYYSLTDIGVTGLYVTNGIFGIIWWIVAHFVLLFDIKKLRGYGDSAGLSIGYLAFSISTCYTLLNFYYSANVLLLILILNHTHIKELERKELLSL